MSGMGLAREAYRKDRRAVSEPSLPHASKRNLSGKTEKLRFLHLQDPSNQTGPYCPEILGLGLRSKNDTTKVVADKASGLQSNDKLKYTWKNDACEAHQVRRLSP